MERSFPAQTGLTIETTGSGGAGLILTVTFVDPGAPVHPPTVAVTIYDPAFAVVAPLIVGFCR
jgi:hypothetical protein